MGAVVPAMQVGTSLDEPSQSDGTKLPLRRSLQKVRGMVNWIMFVIKIGCLLPKCIPQAKRRLTTLNIDYSFTIKGLFSFILCANYNCIC